MRYALLVSVTGLSLAVAGCEKASGGEAGLEAFAAAATSASSLVLHEGLPDLYDASFEQERDTKPTHQLHGYWFYDAHPAISDTDRRSLASSLSDAATFRQWSGEKKCGGFHPDFAVQVDSGGETYFALLCFGCHEAKLFGPGIEGRYDLPEPAFSRIRLLLAAHQSSRPPIKLGDTGL